MQRLPPVSLTHKAVNKIVADSILIFFFFLIIFRESNTLQFLQIVKPYFLRKKNISSAVGVIRTLIFLFCLPISLQ